MVERVGVVNVGEGECSSEFAVGELLLRWAEGRNVSVGLAGR